MVQAPASPNNRYKLYKAAARGVDPRVDLLLDEPEGPLAQIISKAEQLHNSKLKKGYVEACMLCSTDLGAISSVLEIPLEILEVYREFFFDTEGWDRLSKVEHIDSIPSRNHQESMLKLWALNHGLDFIAWRLGKRVSISPVDGLQELFNICMYKSKEAMFNGSTSDASKESTKWVKLSTDISRLLKLWVLDSSAAKRDLEIAIREVVPNFGSIDGLLAEEGGFGLGLDILKEQNESNT